MKDIKSLYLAARKGSKSAIDEYTEAVNNIILSPNNYLDNLEYIINSDIGLASLNEFVDRYGLSISAYNMITEKVDECIEKCESQKKNASKYKDAKCQLESYRDKYRNCFEMYEYFADTLPANYTSTYYSFNENGIQNNKLIGMISKFGEAAIPDMIITAHSTGSIDSLFNYLENHNVYNTPTFYQWLSECVTDEALLEYSDIESIKNIKSKNLVSIVENMRARNLQSFKESMIMGNEDAVLEYSEEEVHALEDLISFKEYYMTCTESFDEANSIQQEIYSLYEEFDGMCTTEFNETIADSVIPMQPSSINEDTWLGNTHNKKTGGVPGYIGNNHDMAHYGEDDDHPKSSDDDEDEKSLEDYRRPSSKKDDSVPEDDDDDIPSSVDSDKDSDDEDDVINKERQAINNYYYYTYNNSLNKNSHSFNKDNSVHNRDDHSRDDHSIHDDHSTSRAYNKTNDDHSYGKHIRSHNNEYDDDEVSEESASPWSLNIFDDGLYTEGKIHNLFDGKHSATCNIKSLPASVAKNIKSINEYLIDEIKDIIERDPELRMSGTNLKKAKQYIRCMRNKKFFSRVGMTAIKLKHNKYFGEIAVLPFIERDTYQSSVVNEVNTDGNFSTGTIVTAQKEDKDFIKAMNHIITKVTEDYMKDNDPNTDDMKLMVVGSDEGTTLKYVVYQLSNEYAEKLFNHIKHPKSNPMNESVLSEAVGDADDDRPESDHPIKDILTDIDRKTTKHQQKAKKAVQNVQNAGRAFVKPIKRTGQWITNMITKWKDTDENNVKERLADPYARKNIFEATKKAIVGGSLLKAGLLLNPVFLFLSVTKGIGGKKREGRIRNEMIAELKTEMEICDEKIKDAERNQDSKAKYQMMRFKNELNKKMCRVAGVRNW